MISKPLKILLFLFIVLLFNSCRYSYISHFDHDDKYISLYRDKLDSGSILVRAWSYYSFEKNNKNFIQKIYYPSTGQITDYTTFTDPERRVANGKAIKWYDNGNLYMEGSYLMNKQVGEWKFYDYDSGKLIEKGYFNNGLQDSLWTRFDTLGNITSECLYKDDYLHGPFRFYEKGKLVEEGIMEKDTVVFDTVYVKDRIGLADLNYEDAILEICKDEETAYERFNCTETKWMKMLYKIFKFPKEAVEQKIEGTAVVRYKVTKEGNIEDIEVLRGVCDSIKESIYKVYNSKPKFLPAVKNGEAEDSYRIDYLPMYGVYF